LNSNLKHYFSCKLLFNVSHGDGSKLPLFLGLNFNPQTQI
jgi:hypothetical protein